MKKIMVSVSFVVLLFLACFVNARYNENADKAKILGEAAYVNNNTMVEEPSDYFYEMREARDKAREDACNLLREVTQNPNTTAEGRTEAEEELINIARHIEGEATCEGILKTRGFSDVMLTVSDDAVTVSVKGTDLLPAQLAQIKDAVMSCTDADADEIKIIPVG